MGKLEVNDGKWKSMGKFWTSQHLAGLSSLPLQTCPWYNPISGETYMDATEKGGIYPNIPQPNIPKQPNAAANTIKSAAGKDS